MNRAARKENDMLLKNKTALIFAANGAISQGVAKAMAREGAHLYLAAHRPDDLEPVVEAVAASGAQVQVERADATDPAAVKQVVDKVYARAGRIDVTFNGIGGRPSELGYPARSTETPFEDFLIPLNKIVGSQFLTAREVAKKMAQTKEGAIVMLSATLSGGAFAYMAGISAACGAVESMTNALAGEFGPQGVRVNCVRGSAMPETRTIQETGAKQAELQ
ncbi:MAG: SDR family oxidoreductase, partial [Myxococcota bacterium]